jgi:hypothetical protein
MDGRPPRRSQVYRVTRGAATVLALATGAGRIATLWLLPPSASALVSAGLGTLFLLLGLGLMGSARLSLILTASLCALSLVILDTTASTPSITLAERALLACALTALLSDTLGRWT